MHLIQQKLLRLAETYNLGSMPFRVTGELIGESHPQVIKYHLEQLDKKKLILWNREKKTIKKINKTPSAHNDFVIIPILGSANCGVATIFADERIDGHLKISKKLLKKSSNIFALQTEGASMNQANIDGKAIESGDYVIVDMSNKNINSGDYVLSVIDDMANIKKITFDLDNDQIILSSESTNSYPPIYIHKDEASRYLVNGKVIQVIKKSKN